MKIEWDVWLVKFIYYFVKYFVCICFPIILSHHLLHDSFNRILISTLACVVGGICFQTFNAMEDYDDKDKK